MEYKVRDYDRKRYEKLGITLEDRLDPLLAPSIADDYQGQGLGSLIMPLIADSAREKGARSIMLMDGTLEKNKRAVAFYKKAGFTEQGQFFTNVMNIDMRMIL